MHAITTFLNHLAFAAVCVLGWAIFPVIIVVGATVLFGYALIAEFFFPTPDAACADSDATASPSTGLRPASQRLRGTLQP